MQSVLMRRKADLEQMLHDARARHLKMSIHRVFPSARSSLAHAETNNEETYTVLGAWDAIPIAIISSKPPLVRRCSGMRLPKRFAKTRGQRRPIHHCLNPAGTADQTPPTPELPSESAVEAAVAE